MKKVNDSFEDLCKIMENNFKYKRCRACEDPDKYMCASKLVREKVNSANHYNSLMAEAAASNYDTNTAIMFSNGALIISAYSLLYAFITFTWEVFGKSDGATCSCVEIVSTQANDDSYLFWGLALITVGLIMWYGIRLLIRICLKQHLKKYGAYIERALVAAALLLALVILDILIITSMKSMQRCGLTAMEM